SNTAISSTAVPIADTIAVGGTSSPVPINKTCSDTLDASEPDTATLSCFCTADLNPNFKATATDSASFDCQTPGLVVTKNCALRDTNGNSAVTCEIKGSVDPSKAGHQKTLTATAKDTCESCSAQVDKQVKCGAGPFVDTGFVTNNEDGTGSCIGWNAGNGMPAEAISVQYAVKNTGTTQLFGCTVSDSNPAISSGPIALGDVAIGGTSPQTPAGALTCSDLLALNEPDTATLSCFCTADKNPSFVATAKDIAKFQCETPGLTV